MTSRDKDVECALLWKLARSHGWSSEVEVSKLVDNAKVQDEQRARDIARNQLAGRDFIGYHNSKDTIWIKGPPGDQVAHHLRDECGYGKLQIEGTLDEQYFDGF